MRVYVCLDPRKPGIFRYGDLEFEYEPFYVGKGIKGREKDFYIGRRSDRFVRKLKRIQIKKLKPVSCIVALGLTDEESIKIEKELILLIGREDRKKGPLVNFTDGGEGAFGRILSKEHKKKISQSLKGRKYSKEVKRRMSESAKKRTKNRRGPPTGGKISDEHKRKVSEGLKLAYQNGSREKPVGPLSGAHKRKISEGLKKAYKEGRRKPINTGPLSEEHKRKISESKKGVPLSDEHKNNIRKNHWRNNDQATRSCQQCF